MVAIGGVTILDASAAALQPPEPTGHVEGASLEVGGDSDQLGFTQQPSGSDS